MKIKTSELCGTALDWAVAKCDGKDADCELHGGTVWYGRGTSGFIQYRPSTNWAQGGPIIEWEGIEVLCNVSPAQAKAFKDANPDWFACLKQKRSDHFHGPTPLIAAMRCYVASKLGDEVDVPEELV